MELRHLRYFVAVAEAENVSHAALRLHVSQPAVSRQVRDLEEELGIVLLERTAKSVRLTEAGRAFLNEARAVLERTEEAVVKVRAIATSGEKELHVGYSPTPTARILPLILRQCKESMPHVRIRLHDWSNEANLAGLRNGKLQVALLVGPPKARVARDLRFEQLSRERPRLAVSPKHRFAGLRSVSLADAIHEPFVVYDRDEFPDYLEHLLRLFAPVKGKPQVVEEHDGFASLLPAIEAGTGVAIVSESFGCLAGGRVKLLHLTPEPSPTILCIAALKGTLSPAVEQFWRCAKEAAAMKA